MKFQQKKEPWSITISCQISIGMYVNALRSPTTDVPEPISLSERLDWLSMHSIKDRIMINFEQNPNSWPVYKFTSDERLFNVQV